MTLETGMPAPAFRACFQSLNRCLSEYSRTFPPINDTRGLVHRENIQHATPILFCYRLHAFACAISLYSIPLSDSDPKDSRSATEEAERAVSRENRMKAAYGMADLIKYVRGPTCLAPIFADQCVTVRSCPSLVSSANKPHSSSCKPSAALTF